MTWSFPIGRLFGSELRIHATFFLLIAWIGVAAWLDGGMSAALVNVVFILALFACVVAHEFGHALMARRFGIRTPDITLLPIGGMARLERMPEKPGQEILVAVAGPMVNVLIWAILVFVFGANSDLTQVATIEDPSTGFFGRLAAVNLFLVVFNMIPAFPMDGGRVFRAVLSIPFGRVRATQIAASAGQILAFFFGFLGLTGGNPLLLQIAIFVFVAASSESSDVVLRDFAREMPARAAMITSFESLGPDDTLEAASSSLIRTTQHEFPVLENEELVGFLSRTALFAALGRKDGPPPHVRDVMTREIPRVPLDAPLTEGLDSLARAKVPAVAVTDHSGAMLGYITSENIGEMMVIRSSRGSRE